MKVLIWGGEARYCADLPHAVQSLPLELVFCPREQSLESMFPQHATRSFSLLTPSRRWTAPSWTGCPACG